MIDACFSIIMTSDMGRIGGCGEKKKMGQRTVPLSHSLPHSRAEETEWYYRIVDNLIVQKRLWSITYGYWKTDWITIGYVEPNP